jgi:hypothetical protein
VVFVVWALALAVSWCCLATGRAQLDPSQWSSPPQAGPAWIVTDPGS